MRFYAWGLRRHRARSEGVPEIVDQFPDPEEELIEIWETWFERMTDGNHPVLLDPDAARGAQILFRRGLRRVDRYLRLTTLQVPVGSKKDDTHEAFRNSSSRLGSGKGLIPLGPSQDLRLWKRNSCQPRQAPDLMRRSSLIM